MIDRRKAGEIAADGKWLKLARRSKGEGGMASEKLYASRVFGVLNGVLGSRYRII
jgi:hypothetical protein